MTTSPVSDVDFIPFFILFLLFSLNIFSSLAFVDVCVFSSAGRSATQILSRCIRNEAGSVRVFVRRANVNTHLTVFLILFPLARPRRARVFFLKKNRFSMSTHHTRHREIKVIGASFESAALGAR